jgi:Response regulator of the LytR/AlgR family
MKIAVCEDEKIFSDKLVGYINEWSVQKNIFVEIFEYNSAESFLYTWSENENIDVIFLDIKMKSMTGIELAKIIRKTNTKIQIIFTTNMREHILTGYTVSAMQYLLKPVNKKDCFICLDKVCDISQNEKYYIYKDNEKTIRIPFSDIIYIEMSSHNATIFRNSESYSMRKTITQIMSEIDDMWFIKCHKSYIVNVRHIESISKNAVTMSEDTIIPVSRNMIDEINEKFINYNTNKR